MSFHWHTVYVNSTVTVILVRIRTCFFHVTLLIYFIWSLTDWYHVGVANKNLFCNAVQYSMKYEIYILYWFNTLTLDGICPQLTMRFSKPLLGWAGFQICVQHIDTVSVTEMIWLRSSQSACNLHIDSNSWVIQISLDNLMHGLVSGVMCKWEIWFP